MVGGGLTFNAIDLAVTYKTLRAEGMSAERTPVFAYSAVRLRLRNPRHRAGAGRGLLDGAARASVDLLRNLQPGQTAAARCSGRRSSSGGRTRLRT